MLTASATGALEGRLAWKESAAPKSRKPSAATGFKKGENQGLTGVAKADAQDGEIQLTRPKHPITKEAIPPASARF